MVTSAQDVLEDLGVLSAGEAEVRTDSRARQRSRLPEQMPSWVHAQRGTSPPR